MPIMSGACLVREGRIRPSDHHYTKAIELQPKWLGNTGTAAWHGKDPEYNKAVADYDKASRWIRPTWYVINRSNRGTASGVRESSRGYRPRDRGRPDWALAYNDRGDIWRDKGRALQRLWLTGIKRSNSIPGTRRHLPTAARRGQRRGAGEVVCHDDETAPTLVLALIDPHKKGGEVCSRRSHEWRNAALLNVEKPVK